ncbi:putative DNA-binding transcriptional regulator AlpA [Neobacillus niacini]|uniref:helix-turn-helix domain-containing protein n=1 Tax=Neobacillus niacini TaxID=86668 RepID=UPI002788C270|nr:helix-turn-helix domain-containing protein [Neobacillus niacini]MDQ1003938.1 putative DNA-binding transcriptional regulator AlpA [Neobacillus niacini]
MKSYNHLGLGGATIGVTKFQKVMLDVKDIMELTGIGRNNAYELMKSGEFQVKKIGNKYLVHEEVFQNWLRSKPLKKRW